MKTDMNKKMKSCFKKGMEDRRTEACQQKEMESKIC